MRKTFFLLICIFICSIFLIAYGNKCEDTGEHDMNVISTVPNTCTESGSLTWACSVCGYTFTETIIPHGHDYDNGIKRKIFHPISFLRQHHQNHLPIRNRSLNLHPSVVHQHLYQDRLLNPIKKKSSSRNRNLPQFQTYRKISIKFPYSARPMKIKNLLLLQTLLYR